MDEEKEEQLKTDISTLSCEFRSFDLSTNNFSAFKPRTIFVDLSVNEHLIQVKKKTDLFFSEKRDYKIKLESRAFHPHITIATRDLFKKDFMEAWPYFSDKKFQEKWKTKGISLLKHNKKNWDVIHTSQFKNL